MCACSLPYKIQSKIFLFTTHLLLLRKATNSAGTGARQSATISAQLVDQSKILAFKALYASR